jgi:hypothetical protein
MKNLKKYLQYAISLLFTTFLFSYNIASAQDYEYPYEDEDSLRTIFKNVNSTRGYGGLSVRYAEIDNRTTYMNGIRGGLITKNNFTIGASVVSFETTDIYDVNIESKARFAGAYGGLLLEATLFSSFPIHLSFPLVIGGGGVVYRKQFDDLSNIDEWGNIDSKAFMIIEPGAELEINVVRFMRIGLGAYYRQISDASLYYTDSENLIRNQDFLNGISYGIILKFGKFK